jgi:dTDP-4-dehydrorhamnose 3,5-epimerase
MTRFVELGLPGLVEVLPAKHGDHRGYFSETYSRRAFEDAGLPVDWIQDNQSFSAARGTVRGLHFQRPPYAQDKLVRVLRGAIYDAAVDLRAGSPTYGRWLGIELSAKKWNQLLVPAGFAHGFMTLEPDCEVSYKVTGPYHRDSEGSILWNDPALGIDWPIQTTDPILSDKDATGPGFADFDTPFKYKA